MLPQVADTMRCAMEISSVIWLALGTEAEDVPIPEAGGIVESSRPMFHGSPELALSDSGCP